MTGSRSQSPVFSTSWTRTFHACLSCPSPPSLEGWLWCAQATQAPFPTAFVAVRGVSTQEASVTRLLAKEMDPGCGMSTCGPWSGPKWSKLATKLSGRVHTWMEHGFYMSYTCLLHVTIHVQYMEPYMWYTWQNTWKIHDKDMISTWHVLIMYWSCTYDV